MNMNMGSEGNEWNPPAMPDVVEEQRKSQAKLDAWKDKVNLDGEYRVDVGGNFVVSGGLSELEADAEALGITSEEFDSAESIIHDQYISDQMDPTGERFEAAVYAEAIAERLRNSQPE